MRLPSFCLCTFSTMRFSVLGNLRVLRFIPKRNMTVACPFRIPLPEPKPFHLAIFEPLEGTNDASLAVKEHGSRKQFTYDQLKGFSRSVANVLNDRFKFQKGDVLLMFAENRVEFPISLFGISAIGGIMTGANPLYKHEELGHQLVDCGAKYIVTTEDRLDLVQKTIQDYKVSNKIKAIFVIDATNQIHSFKTNVPIIPFDDLYASTAKTYPRIDINPVSDPLLLPYSSGTTGLPKGVLLSHYNLQCLLYSRRLRGTYYSLKPDESAILFLPFFHMAGFVGLVLVLYNRSLGVIMQQFDSMKYLAAVRDYKASIIYAVPSVLVFLAKDPSVQKYDLSHVKAVAFGAAPAGKELIEAVAKRLPNLECMIQAYALTESGGIGTLTPAIPVRNYPLGSCGLPHPFAEMKVVSIDGSNEELGPMKQGEIWIRGPSIMLGYHKNPKATQDTVDSNGWLHTGDVGYYDYAGYFYVVDRIKELIKYKAFQVAPAELEDLLLKHPAIQDVAVTGISDPHDPDVGELPTAFVVLKHGHTASEETAISIKRLVADHLAPFKQLRGGVVFIKQIPKGGTGKVLRRALKGLKEDVYGVDEKKSNKARL